MKIGDRLFAPRWWSIALTAAAVSVFVALGNWQLERAAYKDAIQSKFEQRLAEPRRMFRGDESLDDIEYRNLTVDGRFDNSRNFLVDNQLSRGRVGFHVLTPLRLSDSNLVLLVNRGWIAAGETRLPLPAIPAVTNLGRVSGIASFPNPPALRLGELQVSEQWPKLIPHIDLDVIQEQFSEPVLPVILWLAPDQVPGFVREWNPVWMRAEKSRAYATQWFSFAALALIFFVILNLRKPR